MGGKQYREVLRTPGLGVWFAVLVCQRFPVAMAPLALLFLGHAATGSYAVGALLGGGHALAEAVAAGPLGRRFDRRPARGEIALVLGVEAAAFAALAVFGPALQGAGPALPGAGPPLPGAGFALPVAGLLALAAVGGAIPSGAHGGLRALLVRLAPGERRVAALSLESTASSTVWAVAPALAGGLAAVDPRLPLLVMAVLAAAGAALGPLLRDPGPSPAVRGGGLWRQAWPAMAYDGGVMFGYGAVSLALPVLLTEFGAGAGLSGPVLTACTIAGIGGGLAYGARPWRGSPLRHAVLLASGAGLALAGASLTPWLGAAVALLALGGAFQTPAFTARAVALQDLLPQSRWAAGFSGLYAAAGLGYGAAGLAVAWLAERADARTAIGVCAVTGTALALGASAAESRAAARRAAVSSHPEGTSPAAPTDPLPDGRPS
ncbi:hypothetical protein [Nonomuraea sp. NPDC050691]|uniref:hypothetical protein n=1 Tax=Nonomuraea sp. NPDC050691 TaxID=3155661 RepID=UPI0033D56146